MCMDGITEISELTAAGSAEGYRTSATGHFGTGTEVSGAEMS